jgi:hypothetical protein
MQSISHTKSTDCFLCSLKMNSRLSTEREVTTTAEKTLGAELVTGSLKSCANGRENLVIDQVTLPKDGFGPWVEPQFIPSDEKGKMMLGADVGGGRGVQELGSRGVWDDGGICLLLAETPCQKCGGKVKVKRFARGQCEVRVLQLECCEPMRVDCDHIRTIYSGTEVMLKDPTCPAFGVEELNYMLTHFINRGEASQISNATSHWGPARITTKRYRQFLLWLFPTLRDMEQESFLTVIAAMSDEERLAATIGGDGRWGTRGRTAKSGTYSAFALKQSAYPDDPDQGDEMAKVAGRSYCKRMTEEEERVIAVAAWHGSSGEMEVQGSGDSHVDLVKKDVRPQCWLGDDDAGVQKQLKKKGDNRTKQKAKQFQTTGVKIQLCCNQSCQLCERLYQAAVGERREGNMPKMLPKKTKAGANLQERRYYDSGGEISMLEI